jgi:hypothetical protein
MAELVRFRYRSVHDIAILDFAPPLPGAGCGLVVSAVHSSQRLGANGRTVEKGEMPLRDQLDRVEKEFLPKPKVQLYRSDDHLSDWLTAIRNRKRPIWDVEIGASTANLCNLVNLAYYHGQPMKWDPSREKFTGGTGDESWLDIPHRDRLPVRLPADGEPSRLAQAWAWALDARNDELLMFADDGIFRISVDRA